MTTLRTLNVNGQTYQLAVEAHETLLDVLREKLRLTGTKKGCNVGDCGACTVLVDGEPMNSCLLLATEMEGKSITTVEGLARDGHLTPLQKAFVAEGAIQCGYCTSGMVLSATALLARNPHPSPAEIKDALAGHLCRCTGYAGILRAVQSCEKYRGEAGHGDQGLGIGDCGLGIEGPACATPQSPIVNRQSSIVGVSLPRVDAPDKVTGRALYTADIALPNMIHG